MLSQQACKGGFDGNGRCLQCGSSSSTMQILTIFDVGGCGNAQAMDCRIDPCEVAENSIIKKVLAPDVQIFDANGNYAPNKQNTTPDSMSVGLGFTAVQASF